MYLCPGGLTCCINGKIAAPQPRLDLPVQSVSGPSDASLLSQDSSFSNDNLWAYDDDDYSQSETASLLTEPSNDETYDVFLDRIDPNPNSNSIADLNHDWTTSIFNDPTEEAKYYTQEQLPDTDSEDPFTNAIGSNSYLNGPSNELASIFDDASEGGDFVIPDQSLG